MSDKKINKSTLKEAKEQFEEIQKFAIEEVAKNLKEDVSKKVIELMNSSLEDGALNEDITIQAGGTTIEIDEDGEVKINPEGQEGEEYVFSSEENEDDEEDSEEIEVSDEDDEIEIDNSEIDEMNNLEEMNFEEQEAAAPAPAPEAAPAAEAPVEEPMAEPAEETMANPFQALMDKMDQMMSMLGGNAGGEEQIDIVDDTAAAPEAAAPAPEAAPAPVAEEITFEVVNNEMQIPEMGEDDVLEIVGEEDDTMDEIKMMGQSHTVQRTTGDSAGPEKAKEMRQRMAMRENDKAQYEAKIAELIKENESLKSEKEELEAELNKFERGFIKLQENFGQMQDYNAKLVMAYKVAMSGGLTTDEKIQISEQFDKCESVEDAERLYKSIVSEHKIKVNKNPEKSIKSTSIKSTPAKSVSQPLYESAEVSRMKQLAGIRKNEE
jgi:hypothetical protein